MIEDLLPVTAIAVEARGEEDARVFGAEPLFPQEEALMARAVSKRRREFTVVRACARRAMAELGVPAQPVLPGERSAPQWPVGLTGSMTHCVGYAAAALARDEDLVSLGIDAEPHRPLPEGVLEVVSPPPEAGRLRRLAREWPGVHWDRLLFSAKESVYKAWFPLTRRRLDFSEADLDIHVTDTHRGTFQARLLVPGPVVAGRTLTTFEGRWTVRHGLAATAVTVARS